MKVNVSKLSSDIKRLSSFINEYEKAFLNIYNNFKEVSTYWKDPRTDNYMLKINEELQALNITSEELTKLKDVYNYLLDKYSKIGKKIEYNKNSVNSTIKKLDNCIFDLKQALNKYNSLDTGVFPQFNGVIYSHIRTINYNLDSISSIKMTFEKNVAYINEIEENIKKMISKIDIRFVKEGDIGEFI